MELLQLDNLAIARGGRCLLDGLSLTLRAGEAAVIEGPNGIGKTSLLRTVLGVQPSLGGRVSASVPLAYLGHQMAMKPALGVAENLRFWAGVYGAGDIAAAIAAVGLSDVARCPVAALSAGQKQRAGLARLVVSGAGIWLLDEPTVALDTEAVALFDALLSRHLGAGGAALIASHQDIAHGVARRIDLRPYRFGGVR